MKLEPLITVIVRNGHREVFTAQAAGLIGYGCTGPSALESLNRELERELGEVQRATQLADDIVRAIRETA